MGRRGDQTIEWVDMKIYILETGDWRSSAGGGLEHSTEEWWEEKSLGYGTKTAYLEA